LIFFCGLFWRQASANAALVVAVLTIPLGFLFKVVSPELPFILRIGYVFIILSFVMVGLSILDKSHQVESPIPLTAKRKNIRTGWIMIVLASLVGIVVAFFVPSMRNLALEAIYVLVAGFILIGVIIISNNTKRFMNAKGIIIEMGIFNTTPAFNFASIGICGILAVLYFIFW